jgi:mRNA interferase MazF
VPKLLSESYEPRAGDIIWTDFDPRTRREQSGRRPAVVVSPPDFFRASRFVIVCPITSRVRPFGSSVVLRGLPITGEILTSHIRSIDADGRPIRFSGTRVSAEVMSELRAKLAVLLGIG